MDDECKYKCPVCGGAMVWCGYVIDLPDESAGGIGSYCHHCGLMLDGEGETEAGPSGTMGIGDRTDLLQ